MDTIKNITLIGSGNVATHLGLAFFNKGFIINQVFSKQFENASILANKIDAEAIDKLTNLSTDSDLYLICIKDDAIASVVKEIQFNGKLIAHTSGSISINVLNKKENYGIFYPLQTFSKEKEVDINHVPFCIEGNSESNQNALLKLAQKLSENVQLISSEQRKAIHLAAVFACNFSNNMYAIADDILSDNNISLDILKPLIKETAQKITTLKPKDVQTGPAIRNDQKIIKNHLKMLADSKDYQDIYQIISDNIIKQNNGKL